MIFDVGAADGHPWFNTVSGFFRNIFTEAGAAVGTAFGITMEHLFQFSFVALFHQVQNKNS